MKTSCGKFLNFAHYFPYDVKLRLLAHSRSLIANQKARNAIVGAENLLMFNSVFISPINSQLKVRYSKLITIINKELYKDYFTKKNGNNLNVESNISLGI